MSTAHEYEELHDLVDRLSPDQARHLRVLVDSDPELTPATKTPDAAARGPHQPRRFSVAGIWESGRGDLSERHDDIIREKLKRST